MDQDSLRELLEEARERRNVEFKSACGLGDGEPVIKIVRACIGLANTRDGGVVVIGVRSESDGSHSLEGLTDEQASSWSNDDLSAKIAKYADPSVDVEVTTISLDGKTFTVLEVAEFDLVPVLCVKGSGNILRDGAVYVRSRRKVETVEIPRHEDMRQLLDLATEKRLAALLRGVRAAGGQVQPIGDSPSDAQWADDIATYEQELGS